MNSLDDAWEWYVAARDNLKRFGRLARKHWASLPWETASIGRDEEFRALEAETVKNETAKALQPLDDVAVLVLFSVFEAEVRSYVRGEIGSQLGSITHPVLKAAATDAVADVENGSFHRLMEKYKPAVGPDLVEVVNQVRRYRNWVAHGRRSDRPSDVAPQAAYERLSEFLAQLRMGEPAPAVED